METIYPINRISIFTAVVAGILSALAAIFIAGFSWIWIALFAVIPLIVVLAFYVGNLRTFCFYLFVFLLPIAYQKLLFAPAAESGRFQPTLVVSISDIPLMAFIVLTFLKRLRYKTHIERPGKIIIFFFLAWVVWSLLSIFNIGDIIYGRWFALFMVMYLVKILLLFWSVAAFPFNDSELENITRLIIIGAFIQGCIVLLQHFTGYHIGIIGIDAPQYLKFSSSGQGTYSRASGTLGHVNLEAEYFSFVIPIVLSYFMYRKNLRTLVLTGITFGLAAVGLILTYSRGGWLGTGVATIACIYFIVRRPLPFERFGKIFLLGLCIAAVIGFYARPIFDRLSIGDEGATSARVRAMKTALEIIGDHPIIGAGLYNFQEVSKFYGFSEIGAGFYKNGRLYVGVAPVHNRYLLTAAETGLVGFVFFISFLVAVIALGLRYVKCVDSASNRKLGIGVFSAIIGALFYMNLEIFGDPITLTLVMFLICLLYNAYAIRPKLKHA